MFRKVNCLKNLKIIDAACGWDSSMVLTECGTVYTWGSNSHGQLGVSTVAIGDKSAEPQKVNLHGDKTGHKIALGLRHSCLLCNDGSVFVSGDASKGQLGIQLCGNRYVENFIEGN